MPKRTMGTMTVPPQIAMGVNYYSYLTNGGRWSGTSPCLELG